MLDEASLHFEPQCMPVHLQYNFLARDQIPLHNLKNSRDMESNIVTSVTQDHLQIPSHVVLNQANYHCSNNASAHSESGLSSVAITQRLSRSKYMTMIYYKGTEQQTS